MTQDEIIEMARQAGFFVKDGEAYSPSVQEDHELTPYLKAFAKLVRDEILQAITDPENQPSQFGTVTLEYHQEKMKQWEDLFERMSDKAIAQRTWVGLMRGVRVEGDTVVIAVKGGNDAARELCGYLLNEIEVRRGND